MTESSPATESVPEGVPEPPEGPFHPAWRAEPLVWHTGEFQECVPCLVAAGLREPEEPAPAPAPKHTHDTARQALAELGAVLWTTVVHQTLGQTFSIAVDWTGPVPQYCVRIVPADGRELDASSIQELRWDMLSVDPDQVSGQGAG